VIHASVLVLTIMGAGIAFLLLRQRLPSIRVAVWSGIGFAALSFFVLVASFNEGGLLGASAWLLLGSAAVAALGALVGARRGGSHPVER
jgi:multidrug transporter EmrE-like cation transporter